MKRSSTDKLRNAAKLATREARRQNAGLKMEIVVAKADGLYLRENTGKSRLMKKKNLRPVRVSCRVLDLGR
jgi:hypothetical protein